ncbi:hypothetical protein AGR7B_pAt0053 [Agrobacterium deltaense RV3]|nr:hypothetical protein AGR7B_pAt0053 [Agrobacterium deltaense RV3]
MHSFRIRNIQADPKDVGASLPGEGFSSLGGILIDCRDGDLRAFFSKALGDTTSDALVPSGHEDCLACETIHGFPP